MCVTGSLPVWQACVPPADLRGNGTRLARCPWDLVRALSTFRMVPGDRNDRWTEREGGWQDTEAALSAVGTRDTYTPTLPGGPGSITTNLPSLRECHVSFSIIQLLSLSLFYFLSLSLCLPLSLAPSLCLPRSNLSLSLCSYHLTGTLNRLSSISRPLELCFSLSLSLSLPSVPI